MFSDVEIVCENFRKPAHRIILSGILDLSLNLSLIFTSSYISAESTYFKHKLTDPNVKQLVIEEGNVDAVKDVLDFIYKGTVSNLNYRKAKKLLIVSDKVNFPCIDCEVEVRLC